MKKKIFIRTLGWPLVQVACDDLGYFEEIK